VHHREAHPVDGVGHVAARRQRGEALDVTVGAAPEIVRYVVEKGSIAIDGISLTVNQVDDRAFTVSLIPHTQTATTLARKAVGAGVNLEVDLVGKYVEKLVAPHAARAAGVTLEKLRENGFA
jgi:riboflavin synthase